MKKKIEKLILSLYPKMPTGIKQAEIVSDYIGNIAEKHLKEAKRENIRLNWQRMKLERELKRLREVKQNDE